MHWASLSRVLRLREVPSKLVYPISELCSNTSSAVRCEGGISDFFPREFWSPIGLRSSSWHQVKRCLTQCMHWASLWRVLRLLPSSSYFKFLPSLSTWYLNSAPTPQVLSDVKVASLQVPFFSIGCRSPSSLGLRSSTRSVQCLHGLGFGGKCQLTVVECSLMESGLPTLILMMMLWSLRSLNSFVSSLEALSKESAVLAGATH